MTGPSAHSFVEPRRWWNHRSLEKYLEVVSLGELPVCGGEQLKQGQLMLETVCLGLRTSNGISTGRFKRRYRLDFFHHFAPVVEKLQTQGMLSVTSDRCSLTREGMIYADAISGMFAELVPGQGAGD